jgi:hypothetical protein
MPQKLKIILGVLILAAAFLVIRVGSSFYRSAKTAALISQIVITPAPEENLLTKDSDNDGIPDYLEAYYRTDPFNPDTDGDGYLDGEEIVAGTDPLKKDSPPVIAGTQSPNVTDATINRLIAGIYSGDLNPGTGDKKKYDAGVNSLTLATIDDALKALTPKLAENTVVIDDDSKQAKEKYLQNVAHLLEGPFLDSFMQQTQTLNKAVNLWATGDYDSASKIFDDLSLKFATAYTELLALPVPSSWIDFHKHLLATFQKISINYSVLSRAGEDPILGMAAFSDFSNNMLDIDSSLMQELKLLIQKDNLEIPKTPFFETLDILNYKSSTQ